MVRKKYDKGALMKFALVMLSLLSVESAWAAQNIGSVASTIYSNFANIAKLITAGAYIAGLGFSIGAIMKFKQHKDNPTQVPIGTPIALVMIAACLLFLPSILGVAGQSIFEGGTVATDTGVAWTPGS